MTSPDQDIAGVKGRLVEAIGYFESRRLTPKEMRELLRVIERLGEDRDTWRRVAERLEGEKNKAQARCERLRQHAHDLQVWAELNVTNDCWLDFIRRNTRSALNTEAE